jgi:hypothetical protein
MDRHTDWPWSWEEETEWKADMEERDYSFIEELIDNAVEDSASVSAYIPDSFPQEVSEDTGTEKYCVMA